MEWDDETIQATVLNLVAERGAGKTICPSEVARHLGGAQPDHWRPLMPAVRRAAVRLVVKGKVAILRGGVPVVDLDGFTGIYRIGVPRDGR